MKKETIREKLNRIDHMCIDNDLTFYDLRSMLEAVAPKLSPQDKEEVKKVIQSTDDPETIAAVLAVKSETNEDYDDLDDDILNEYKDEQISIANKTSRSNGASALNKDGSIRSVVGKYVLQNVPKDASILDFGAGKDAVQTQALISSGFDDVTAYDFGINVKDGVHDPDALSKTYDVVFASNVLNVSSDEDMLRETLSEIYGACKNGGTIIFNYPSSPRKAGFTTDEVEDIIIDSLNVKPEKVGGTKSAPVWKITKGNVITERFHVHTLEPLKDVIIDIIDYFDSTDIDIPDWVPGIDSWDELRDKIETNSNFIINIVGNILDFMEYNYLEDESYDDDEYQLLNDLIYNINQVDWREYTKEDYSEDDAAKNGRDIGSAVGSVLGTIAPGLDKDVMTAATGATGELMARSSYRKNYNK